MYCLTADVLKPKLGATTIKLDHLAKRDIVPISICLHHAQGNKNVSRLIDGDVICIIIT